jgi:hypothetical protein
MVPDTQNWTQLASKVVYSVLEEVDVEIASTPSDQELILSTSPSAEDSFHAIRPLAAQTSSSPITGLVKAITNSIPDVYQMAEFTASKTLDANCVSV